MTRRIAITALAVVTLTLSGLRSSLAQEASGHASADAEHPPLVERNRIDLTLGGAHTIIGAARKQARSMGLKVNITVVDDGGHPIAFARMDGARPASSYTSMTKATAAATLRQATGPVGPTAEGIDTHLNLSLQLTASASGGKVTTLYGGVPVVVDEQVIGAVGVGGGTGEQDAEIARAGIAALLDALGDSADSGDNR